MRPRVILVANEGAASLEALETLAASGPVDADFAVHVRFDASREPETWRAIVTLARSELRVPVFASVTPPAWRESELAGIHLGGERRPDLATARAAMGPGAWISVPSHDDDDVSLAARDGATATYVSPIFPKPGKGAPRGLDALRRARSLAGSVLVYALGGVDLDNAEKCVVAGADGVAVIRSFFRAESPRGALLALDAAVLRGTRDAARDPRGRCP